MRSSRRFIPAAATVVFATLMLWGTSASAQYFANDDRPGLIISTTTTTSALVGGAIIFTVVSIQKEPTAMLRRYLHHNEPAVRHALATGAGESLRDFAGFFGIDDERRFRVFARMARRHRERWTALAYEQADIEALIRDVQTAIQFEPRLRPGRTPS